MELEPESIEIRGARTHNLRALDIDIPLGKITAITGVSGSGKSSLAFDTIHAEGQRRYLEGLAPFARRLLDQFERPPVDSIRGLPPTISVEQAYGGMASNPRSTVATLTEIDDYLRILFAKFGSAFCPSCGREIVVVTESQILDAVDRLAEGDRFHLLAPLVVGKPGSHREAFFLVKREGFLRARIDGVMTLVDAPRELAPGRPHDFEMVVDRQIVRPGLREKLRDSLRTALKFGGGSVVIARETENGDWDDHWFDTIPRCRRCDVSFPALEPRHFSASSPHGACPQCQGLGKVQSTSDSPNQEPSEVRCPDCGGTRLGLIGRTVRLGGLPIADFLAQSVDDARVAVAGLEFPAELAAVWTPPLREIKSRLDFLERVGVGYLELNRPVTTLSGGEVQRIRLAGCLGSGLSGVCYILDEPTAGLHSRDVERLLGVIDELCDGQTTVILVDHDEKAIARADLVVDLGPGAGPNGGMLVQQAPFDQFVVGPGLTAEYLSGRRRVSDEARNQTFAAPATKQPLSPLTIEGARRHNLQNLAVHFPLGKLIAVTGVSGSGKSSLVVDLLVPAVRHAIGATKTLDREIASQFNRVAGFESIKRLVVVDQAPMGQSPRSTPATYLGVTDHLRKVFAATRDAKLRGFGAARFAIGNKQGACGHCQGLGAVQLDFEVMAPVWTPCPVCRGARYNRATLAIKFKGLSIAQVLGLTIDEAGGLLENHPKIAPALSIACAMGLGYLKLGQWATTLSGGEAERIKLCAELARPEEGNTLYVLDEPTRGLHFHDVAQLAKLLRRLSGAGNTVIVIEHHLDMIAAADWIIDLGPDGGKGGGRLLAEGPPEIVAQRADSHTGQALNKSARSRLGS